MSTTPTLLYKYEPPTLQSLRNLKTQTIFFGSPTRFNDPYDCALKPRIKHPSLKQIETFRQRYASDQRMSEAGRQEISELTDDQVAAMLVRSATDFAEKHIQKFLKTNGVTCFSETKDNLLMWSHYADRGQGFCLEFDTAYTPFEKVRKVDYSVEIPEIDLMESLLEKNYDEMTRLYCTKSKHWSYEQEWRGIHKEANISFTYDARCLKGVYFGTEISRDILEIACLVLQGQNSHVRFYGAKRSSDNFIVEFDEFTYTSYSANRSATR